MAYRYELKGRSYRSVTGFYLLLFLGLIGTISLTSIDIDPEFPLWQAILLIILVLSLPITLGLSVVHRFSKKRQVFPGQKGCIAVSESGIKIQSDNNQSIDH